MKRGLIITMSVCLLLAGAVSAGAQTITTGNISGMVEDQQGGRLPGATIQAVHTATGTTYQAVSQAPDGRFSILNVRVGDYTVKATLNGFKEAEQKGITVALGEERKVDFTLELAARAETVTVTADVAPIDLTRAGTAANITREVTEALPTIARSLQDLARTNVYFNPQAFNEETPTVAVAGRSQRYNSLQIDGAVNNDIFGLGSTAGVPGGTAGTQPISLDAIQEIQLVVSPYDVRQSGFSGGGINAITKTGSNQIRGTAFYFARNQNWVGTGVENREISTFKDSQGGFSIGGPMAQNKAFYFGTFDLGRRSTPSGFSINSSGVRWGNEAAVDRFLSILRDRYDYDLGPDAKDEFIRVTDSDKVFVRTDFNLSRQHQLTLRHNFVDARNDVGFPTNILYYMPDNFYRFNSVTNSTVGQLTSRFGTSVNELRVTYTRVRDRRGAQPDELRPFPFVDVTVSPGFRVRAGRENFSSANELDQDMFEVTDNFTRVVGSHVLTVGTHNEFFKIRNLFIRDAFGNYGFASLDLFEQGLAQSFDHSFSNTGDPRQAAKFDVRHFGFYAGDQWRATGRLTVTAGTRVDIVRFPDTPNANPVAETNFGYRTDIVPNNVLWSPRAGFNWDRKGDGSEQIRGGAGVFAGRPPYVWISNQYGNTGIDFTRLSRSFNNANRIAFQPDALNQPKTLTGGTFATNEIDLVNPDFKYPSVARGNLAYDRKLPYGLYGTIEFLWSSVIDDIRYENVNLVEVRTQPVDGRPIYGRKVTSLSNVLLLTNSNEGDSWSLAFEIKRPFRNGFFFNGSYLYGRSRSTMDGTRDQALSMWAAAYVPGDPNHPPIARSDYDPGHRITLSGSYDFPLGHGYFATASIFYGGQSGRPFSLAWGSPGVNGDSQQFNDLLYVPGSPSELTFVGGTYDEFIAFLQSIDCADEIGQIATRNNCRAPFSNQLDARFTVKMPFRRVRAEVTLDILNMLNLFDRGSGLFRYASFNEVTAFTPVTTGGVVTGMNISQIKAANYTPFFRSDLRSRWQMQLGGRIRF